MGRSPSEALSHSFQTYVNIISGKYQDRHIIELAFANIDDECVRDGWDVDPLARKILNLETGVV